VSPRPASGTSAWTRLELDLAYQVPDDAAARWELRRRRHADLRYLSRTALLFEHERVLARIQHDPSPDPWLFARARAIARRLARAR